MKNIGLVAGEANNETPGLVPPEIGGYRYRAERTHEIDRRRVARPGNRTSLIAATGVETIDLDESEFLAFATRGHRSNPNVNAKRSRSGWVVSAEVFPNLRRSTPVPETMVCFPSGRYTAFRNPVLPQPEQSTRGLHSRK